MKKPEQIDRDEKSPGHKKYLKKLAHRTIRRLATRDPMNAPTKISEITYGYSR